MSHPSKRFKIRHELMSQMRRNKIKTESTEDDYQDDLINQTLKPKLSFHSSKTSEANPSSRKNSIFQET